MSKKERNRRNKNIAKRKPVLLKDQNPELKRMYKEWDNKKRKEEYDAEMEKMTRKRDNIHEILTNHGVPFEINHKQAKEAAEKKKRADIDYAKLSQYCKEKGIDESMLNTQTKGDQILIMWVNEFGEARRESLPLAEFAKQKETGEK